MQNNYQLFDDLLNYNKNAIRLFLIMANSYFTYLYKKQLIYLGIFNWYEGIEIAENNLENVYMAIYFWIVISINNSYIKSAPLIKRAIDTLTQSNLAEAYYVLYYISNNDDQIYDMRPIIHHKSYLCPDNIDYNHHNSIKLLLKKYSTENFQQNLATIIKIVENSPIDIFYDDEHLYHIAMYIIDNTGPEVLADFKANLNKSNCIAQLFYHLDDQPDYFFELINILESFEDYYDLCVKYKKYNYEKEFADLEKFQVEYKKCIDVQKKRNNVNVYIFDMELYNKFPSDLLALLDEPHWSSCKVLIYYIVRFLNYYIINEEENYFSTKDIMILKDFLNQNVDELINIKFSRRVALIYSIIIKYDLSADFALIKEFLLYHMPNSKSYIPWTCCDLGIYYMKARNNIKAASLFYTFGLKKYSCLNSAYFIIKLKDIITEHFDKVLAAYKLKLWIRCALIITHFNYSKEEYIAMRSMGIFNNKTVRETIPFDLLVWVETLK